MVSTCYTASGDQLVRLPWLEEGVSVEKRLWQRLAIRRNDNKCERVSYPVRVILWMESQMLKHWTAEEDCHQNTRMCCKVKLM